MNTHIRRQHESGQTMISYALILMLVGVVALAALTAMGQNTSDAYEEVNCGLEGNTAEGCEEEAEEEREDPCPDIQLVAKRSRCRADERLQIVVQVFECQSVQFSAPQLPGLNRVVKPDKILVRKTWSANNNMSQSFCQAGGANLSTDNVSIRFDHDGTGEFITNQTLTISRP